MDDKTSNIGMGQSDLRGELKRHRCMLAGLVLDNSIHKGLDRIQRNYFEEFMFKMRSSDNQITAVLAFREVCVRFEKQRQQKYYDIWARNKLKPMKLLRVNQKITDFMLQHEFKRVMLTKWNHQLITKKRVQAR